MGGNVVVVVLCHHYHCYHCCHMLYCYHRYHCYYLILSCVSLLVLIKSSGHIRMGTNGRRIEQALHKYPLWTVLCTLDEPLHDDKHPRLTAYARFRYWVILTVASTRRVLPQQEECCLSKKHATCSYPANLPQERSTCSRQLHIWLSFDKLHAQTENVMFQFINLLQFMIYTSELLGIAETMVQVGCV